MALNLAQRDALTTNAAFIARCRTAVADRAEFHINNAGSSTSQKAWAANMLRGGKLAQATANLMPELCTDPAVKNSTTGDGSDVTDAALLAAVQAYCENYD